MSFEKLTPAGDLPSNMAQTRDKEKAVAPEPKDKTAD
jgi:hypothetical protein